MTYMPRNPHGFTHAKARAASQHIDWRPEDIDGGKRCLDFDKPFLPSSLSRANVLDFLDAGARLALDHIRANGYLFVIRLIEELILPFVPDRARPMPVGDAPRARALPGIAQEQAKHVRLIRAFERELEAGLGDACSMIGPADAIGSAILAHHPLAVALLVLHVECMTQQHHLESIRDKRELDEQFESLLRQRACDNARRAQLDTLLIVALADGLSAGEIDNAVDGYIEIGFMLDGRLRRQAAFDLDALERVTGRRFERLERERIVAVQHQAMRWTYLGSGMSHPDFAGTLDQIAPGRAAWLAEATPAFV